MQTLEVCPWISIMLDSIADISSNTRVFWIDTPHKGNSHLSLRNSLVHDHVMQVRESHNVSLYYVPLEMMSTHHQTFPRIDDGVHYTCKTMQYIDNQIEGTICTTEKADCIDMMNLNLVQMILGTACYT